MDNTKDDRYYLKRIITDLSFILNNTADLTSTEELESNEILLDSVMFRLIQISENSNRLSAKFKEEHSGIPWHAMRGMRNRIVHDYGDVDYSVVFDTLKFDLPALLKDIENIE